MTNTHTANKLSFTTFEQFWDAANVALCYRDLPQMLYGEAKDAYAAFVEDWQSRNAKEL